MFLKHSFYRTVVKQNQQLPWIYSRPILDLVLLFYISGCNLLAHMVSSLGYTVLWFFSSVNWLLDHHHGIGLKTSHHPERFLVPTTVIQALPPASGSHGAVRSERAVFITSKHAKNFDSLAFTDFSRVCAPTCTLLERKRRATR